MSKVIKWRMRIAFKFRRNVVGFIVNDKHQFLVVSPNWRNDLFWAIPQGGVEKGETDEKAIMREMSEELVTDEKNFRILKKVDHFYQYTWPRWARLMKGYKGQKQTMFLLKFIGDDSDINIRKSKEIKAVKWVEKENLVNTVEQVRREMVCEALKYL